MIKTIYLNNIRSFKDVTFDLEPGKIAITGKNGVGKTTIIDVIGYVLFDLDKYRKPETYINEKGEEVNERSLYEFLRKGTTRGKMEITLEVENPQGNLDEIKVIVRLKKVGKKQETVSETWRLFKNGARVPNIRESASDVHEALWDLLNLDRDHMQGDFFKNVLCIPQGLITEPFKLTPVPRMNYFDEVLNIPDYKILGKKIKMISKLLQEEIENIETETQLLQAKIDGKEEILQEKEGWENQIQENAAEIKKKSETLQAQKEARSELKEKREEIDKLKSAIKSIESALKEIKANQKSTEEKLKDAEEKLEDIDFVEHMAEQYKSTSALEEKFPPAFEQAKNAIQNEIFLIRGPV